MAPAVLSPRSDATGWQIETQAFGHDDAIPEGHRGALIRYPTVLEQLGRSEYRLLSFGLDDDHKPKRHTPCAPERFVATGREDVVGFPAVQGWNQELL